MRSTFQSFSRGAATLALLSTGVVFSTTADAQTAYEWLGNGTGGTNQTWQGLTGGFPRWEDITTPSNPAADIPGSLVGASNATDDVANLRNTRNVNANGAQQTEAVNLPVDIGQIATVQVGGYRGTAPVAGAWTTQINVVTAGAAEIGQLILGRSGEVTSISDATLRDRGGQLSFNANATGTVFVGSVISEGTDPTNEIILNENASGGLVLNGNIDVAGTREIGIDIRSSTQSRFLLGGVLTLNVDDFKVASVGNANATAIYDFGGSGAGSTVNANSLQVGVTSGTNNASDFAVDGTLTLSSESTIDVQGSTGLNGDIDIGSAVRTSPGAAMTVLGAQSATGSVLVESATLRASNLLSLGVQNRDALSTTNPPVSSGTLSLNQTGSSVTIGRVQNNGAGVDNLSGGMNVGEIRTGSGAVFVNDGDLTSLGRVFVGGAGNQGADRGTTGSIVVAAGELNVGLEDLTNGGTRIATLAGGGSTQLGQANLEIGRDGTGFLTITGGTVNVHRGSLILGASGAGTQATPVGDYDNDPMTADAAVTVSGLAAYDYRNELNSILYDQSPTGGDIEPVDPMDLAGNWKLTAAGIAKLQPNTARGTLNLSGGTLNVGTTQGVEYRTDAGAGSPGDLEVLNNFDMNGGGGDAFVSGTGVLNVEQNLNMGAVNAGALGPNSLTISDSATLNIGFGAPGDLAGQASLISVIGTGTDVNISDDLILNGSSVLTFDFSGSNATDFNFDVADNANLNNATLSLVDGLNVLASYHGDISLIDSFTVQNTFSNVVEGQIFGAYKLTYAFAGANGVGVGLVAVPEPSSLAALGLGCLGLLVRRRRRVGACVPAADVK